MSRSEPRSCSANLLGGDRRNGYHQRVRAEIIELNLPLAVGLARRFRHRGQPLDDLIQVASLALTKAVDGFDPDTGVGFAGYAIPTIRGHLNRHFRSQGWDVRVPRRLQERYLLVRRAREDLLGEYDADLDTTCDRQALSDALRRLPDRERQILTSYFSGDLTQAEIGRRVGISQIHVSRLVAQALTRCRGPATWS